MIPSSWPYSQSPTLSLDTRTLGSHDHQSPRSNSCGFHRAFAKCPCDRTRGSPCQSDWTTISLRIPGRNCRQRVRASSSSSRIISRIDPNSQHSGGKCAVRVDVLLSLIKSPGPGSIRAAERRHGHSKSALTMPQSSLSRGEPCLAAASNGSKPKSRKSQCFELGRSSTSGPLRSPRTRAVVSASLGKVILNKPRARCRSGARHRGGTRRTVCGYWILFPPGPRPDACRYKRSSDLRILHDSPKMSVHSRQKADRGNLRSQFRIVQTGPPPSRPMRGRSLLVVSLSPMPSVEVRTPRVLSSPACSRSSFRIHDPFIGVTVTQDDDAWSHPRGLLRRSWRRTRHRRTTPPTGASCPASEDAKSPNECGQRCRSLPLRHRR